MSWKNSEVAETIKSVVRSTPAIVWYTDALALVGLVVIFIGVLFAPLLFG